MDSITSYEQIARGDKAVTPWCTYCLAKGYGNDESTPGFYVPCGCQNVCVDVTGQVTLPSGAQLKTCQDYIDNNLVSTCCTLHTAWHSCRWTWIAFCFRWVQQARKTIRHDFI